MWYSRLGFEPAGPQGFTCRWSGGDPLMVRPLEGGALPTGGRIARDEAFDASTD